MAEEEQATEKTDKPKQKIRTQKVYLKDVSFETPNSPQIFLLEWEPETTLDFSSAIHAVGDNLYELVLTLTVTTSVEGKTAYLAEVHQAGVFLVKDLEPDELQHALNVPCMNLIYPYACAAVSDLVSKGGFHQLMLSPLSFENIYRRRLKQAQEEGQEPATEK